MSHQINFNLFLELLWASSYAVLILTLKPVTTFHCEWRIQLHGIPNEHYSKPLLLSSLNWWFADNEALSHLLRARSVWSRMFLIKTPKQQKCDALPSKPWRVLKTAWCLSTPSYNFPKWGLSFCCTLRLMQASIFKLWKVRLPWGNFRASILWNTLYTELQCTPLYSSCILTCKFTRLIFGTGLYFYTPCSNPAYIWGMVNTLRLLF